MDINEYGSISLAQEELFESLYSGKIKNFKNLCIDQEAADQYNAAVWQNCDDLDKLESSAIQDLTIPEFDKQHQKQWFMPDNYFPNLIEYLYDSCTTDEQRNRVSQELELFVQHNMLGLLFYLKYLVDTMQENNIVWGVGRGSSVASYCLYLIGIHKIDSIKYGLDITEFLK
jgi:DNA polymerase III alpha subunit